MAYETLNKKNQYQDKMENLDDKELLNVITKGTDYEPQAVKAAVAVAVKRELISQEDGDNILGYTLGKIEENEVELVNHVKQEKKKGGIEMISGILIFVLGLALTAFSYHLIWIGALVFGPILFLRGLFKQ
jgi:hypothetical protein